MKIKCYRMTEGGMPKLVGEVSMVDAQAKGFRIVETGRGHLVAVDAPDSISTAEIKEAIAGTSMVQTVHLREDLKADIQAKLDKIRNKQGIKSELKAAFKKLMPDASDEALDIMVSGEAPQDKQEWIK